MMTIKQFITESLRNLGNNFPNITIKYAFDAMADMHVVEITPQIQYYNNPQLDNAWVDISFKILSNYPNELISFITDDCSVKIDNPELIIEGTTNNLVDELL